MKLGYDVKYKDVKVELTLMMRRLFYLHTLPSLQLLSIMAIIKWTCQRITSRV